MTLQAPPRPNGTLDHQDAGLGPRKRRVLEVLEAYPGLNLDEVALALGVRRTAAKHHLLYLEKVGLVARLRWGRHRLHFTQTVPPSERIVFCLVRVPSLLGLARELMLDPALDGARLAGQLQVSPRTVRRGLRLLTRNGLARVQPGPHGPVATLHPRLRVLLAREAAVPPLQGDTP